MLHNFASGKVFHTDTFLPYTVDTTMPEPLFQYGGTYLCNAVQSFQQEDTVSRNPCDELHQYLQSDLETTTDILRWWGGKSIFVWCGHITNGTSPLPDIQPWSGLHGTILPYKAQQPHLSVLSAMGVSRVAPEGVGWSQSFLRHFSSWRVLIRMGIYQCPPMQQTSHMEMFLKSLDSLCDTDNDSE